jgi:hypothetical protein
MNVFVLREYHVTAVWADKLVALPFSLFPISSQSFYTIPSTIPSTQYSFL